MNEKLAAKVKATNKANQTAIELYPKLVAVFRPLIGQKIVKIDGSLLTKIADLLPPLPNDHDLRVYRNRSEYTLSWIVNASEQVNDHSCTYAEIGLYIGDLNGNVLTKIYDEPQLRANYTVTEVEAQRAAYWSAQKVADAAKSALHPFGEYDT